MNWTILKIAVAATAMSIAGAAWAIQPAVGSTSCEQGAYYGNPLTCDAGSVQSSRSLSPDPTVMSQFEYPGGFAMEPGSGSAEITYYFTVDGPATADLIPVDVDYRLAGERSSTAVDYFSTIVVQPNFTNGDGGDSRTLCTSSDFSVCSSAPPASEAGTIHVFSSLGELGSVYIFESVGGPYSADASSGFASVDPYLYIDPSFADRAAYSIELSPGVGNSPLSAVPEPAAWTMMIAGFASVGFAARRRRRPATTGRAAPI